MEPYGVQWSGSAPTDMPRIAIVAALEREVAPLIRTWRVRWVEHGGRRYKFFENQEASLVCSGMGPEAARRATEAMIQEIRPTHILSVGFVGGLDPGLKVGAIFEPRMVVNAADGAKIDTGCGAGTLLSFSAVAGREQKRKLRDAYGAGAVDMEAAAVAQGAESRGVSFSALKVVSDEAGFAMPPVEKFVGTEGRFYAARFAVHVAMRPQYWGATMALARNSGRASQALCAALEQYLSHVATVESETHP
jgi:adenosylhomocysteine nucleosidase